jgi:hypothetical protein
MTAIYLAMSWHCSCVNVKAVYLFVSYGMSAAIYLAMSWHCSCVTVKAVYLFVSYGMSDSYLPGYELALKLCDCGSCLSVCEL